MPSAHDLVKLAKWGPFALRCGVGLSVASTLWLAFSLYLQINLYQSGSANEGDSSYLRVILPYATLFDVAVLLVHFLGQRWVGLALHYLTAEELRDTTVVLRRARFSAGVCLVMHLGPAVHALILKHSLYTTWSAGLALALGLVFFIVTQLTETVRLRLRHIVKIVRQEVHGSTTTMRALKGMSGPGSTMKRPPPSATMKGPRSGNAPKSSPGLAPPRE